jgi:hypothetical protein
MCEASVLGYLGTLILRQNESQNKPLPSLHSPSRVCQGRRGKEGWLSPPTNLRSLTTQSKQGCSREVETELLCSLCLISKGLRQARRDCSQLLPIWQRLHQLSITAVISCRQKQQAMPSVSSHGIPGNAVKGQPGVLVCCTHCPKPSRQGLAGAGDFPKARTLVSRSLCRSRGSPASVCQGQMAMYRSSAVTLSFGPTHGLTGFTGSTHYLHRCTFELLILPHLQRPCTFATNA